MTRTFNGKQFAPANLFEKRNDDPPAIGVRIAVPDPMKKQPAAANEIPDQLPVLLPLPAIQCGDSKKFPRLRPGPLKVCGLAEARFIVPFVADDITATRWRWQNSSTECISSTDRDIGVSMVYLKALPGLTAVR
ncbi:hypothetical protein OKW43_003982 [Paraburkholderia sp. WC7.3g]|uniref:hypothetical protein n=1 Tax=Paraburkholderia sp. WC7.3g TaxID=2991070 RepID=UPI003D1AEB1F